jgi:lipopolysaccharide export system protein LptA
VSISGNTITATVSANTGDQRTSTITVTASDGATATLPVTQYKKSVITAHPEAFYFDATGDTVVLPSPEPDEPTDAP